MVGLGGGFVLVPILRLFLGFSPADAAGTSLVLIVANSASGAFTYLLHRRVHLKIGLLIAARRPSQQHPRRGAVAAHSGSHLRRAARHLLIAVAIDMAWNAERRMAGRPEPHRIHEIKGMSYRGRLDSGSWSESS